MAIPIEVLDYMDYLSDTHKNWENLPENHPDIIKLRQLQVLIDDERPVFKTEWTDSDVKYLRNVYSIMTDREIAKQLDMSEDRVYRKRRELRLRRKVRYPRSKAVYQLDVNGNRLRRFDSVKAAAHFIGGSPNAIAYVCRGERPLFRGFGWEYE